MAGCQSIQKSGKDEGKVSAHDYVGNSDSDIDSDSDLDKMAAAECKRIEDFLFEKKNASSISYPRYNIYRLKDYQVGVDCQIPYNKPIHELLVHIVQELGWKDDACGRSRMILQSDYGSPDCWGLTLTQREEQSINQVGELKKNKKHEGGLTVCIYELGSKSLGSQPRKIGFEKWGRFSSQELKAVASTLEMVSLKIKRKIRPRKTSKRPLLDSSTDPLKSPPLKKTTSLDLSTDPLISPPLKKTISSNLSTDPLKSPPLKKTISLDLSTVPLKAPPLKKTIDALKAMGVSVFGLDESCQVLLSEGGISWDNIAGYEEQKREIEDTIVLSLRCPQVYETIAQGTRITFESVRPRAVLFEGPPGTGKTSCARVIANQVGIPLLCVPLEVIASKYYGESENLLARVFSLADEFPDGSLIFLDEVDSLAIHRDNETSEATRRVLSVLLHQIDGFKQNKKRTIIAATNRKEDLDPAFISRFDSIITFGLPDEQTRARIAYLYAKHLTKLELSQLVTATHEMSGRDIKDICQQAERRWASKIIRGIDNLKMGDLPDLQEYLGSTQLRRKVMIDISIKRATRFKLQRLVVDSSVVTNN